MPDKRILTVLGMSAAEWGALPPERGALVAQGVQTSDDRANLRKKAVELLANEQNESDARRGSLPQDNRRIDNVEAALAGVSNDISRRFEALEQRMNAMERGFELLVKKTADSDK